jgi:hypothetical protein
MLVSEAVQQKDQEPHSCIKCLPIGDTGRIYYDAIFNE